MNFREKCKSCGNQLAYKGQVCTECGLESIPPKVDKPKHYLHHFFFIVYFLLEVFGFLYCLGMVRPKGGDNAPEAYIFFRIVLLLFTCIAYVYGRRVDSTTLRGQGGCLGIFSLILLLLMLFLLSDELF